MKLFRCSARRMTLEVIDIPRRSWRVLPPKKWQVMLVVAGIILSAIVWSLL